MISLFTIPSYNIDTSKFKSLLHDDIVTEFENNFASYVGAKYAVSLNSATNAIYLINKLWESKSEYIIPTMIPPVVCNAIITSGGYLAFKDNTSWVGNSFLLDSRIGWNIFDSAQKVERNQFINESIFDEDLIYFSFYPTKMVSSCDGGMIVSNDKSKIDLIRQMTFNGMSQESNNWERKQNAIGYKMYMNSLSVYIANENLKKLDKKKRKILKVREKYNDAFGLNNTSEHLYRINVKNRDKFMQRAKGMDIVCGIHYDCAHLNPIFKHTFQNLKKSEKESKTTVSIPMHEELTEKDIDKVIKLVNG